MMNGKLRWDWPPFTAFAKVMKQAAKDVKIPIEWGGDWRTFRDGPHYQLPHRQYP
jgi:peptidoglycan L-alanyl-D-glutamate endopeptidase CwlK